MLSYTHAFRKRISNENERSRNNEKNVEGIFTTLEIKEEEYYFYSAYRRANYNLLRQTFFPC